MKKLLLLLILTASAAGAATLTGSLEFRINSRLQDLSAIGNAADTVDYSLTAGFGAGERYGTITQIYRADVAVGTAGTVLGLVGSLTNPIGETVTFTSVSGLFIENTISTGPVTLSGFATATIQPYGAFAQIGTYTVASFGDRLTISTPATTTLRVWIVGN